MATMDDATSSREADSLYGEFERLALRGHWQPRALPPKPVPRLWRWSEIHPVLMEAARVIDLGKDASRRFVGLQTRSQTLSFGYQIVMPGENAEAHRHSASALRFVVQGGGAFTTSNGEPMSMQPGDMLTQPNWVWHDHTNSTSEPIIWVDSLDAGLVRALNAQFGESWPGGNAQPLIRPPGYSRQRFGAARSPADKDWAVPFHYPWPDTEKTLHLMAQAGEVDPYDGVLLSYANPVTGGYTSRNLACYIQMLRPGEKTRTHRHTGIAIYHVFEGTGVTLVGQDPSNKLEWQDKDAFVVPPWEWHHHENLSQAPAYLFSVSDRPIVEAAGLHREEAQPI